MRGSRRDVRNPREGLGKRIRVNGRMYERLEWDDPFDDAEEQLEIIQDDIQDFISSLNDRDAVKLWNAYCRKARAGNPKEAIHDISDVDRDDLYDRLFSEVTEWLEDQVLTDYDPNDRVQVSSAVRKVITRYV